MPVIVAALRQIKTAAAAPVTGIEHARKAEIGQRSGYRRDNQIIVKAIIALT
jgi:hypothetical protein